MSARLTGRMRRLAVAVGAVALLAIGATAYAAIPNADGNIYACYSNGDGSVRVQNDPAKPCAKNWSPLKWAAAQPDGVSGYEVVESQGEEVLPFSTNVIIKTAVCPEGKVPVGGGGFAAAITGATADGGLTNIARLNPTMTETAGRLASARGTAVLGPSTTRSTGP